MKRILFSALCLLLFAANAVAQVEIPAVQITGALPIFAQSSTPYNTAFGSGVLTLSTGVNNTGVGYTALQSVVSGHGNTGIGQASIATDNSGSNNSALGSGSLQLATGTGGTCIGVNCLANVSSGGNNTAIGLGAGGGITTGANNTIVGPCTGFSAGTAATVDICTGDGTLHLDWGFSNASEWTIKGNIVSSGTVPTIASGACGATANGTVTGTDNSGFVTIGASATTSCAVSFHTTLAVAPSACIVSPANAAAAVQVATVATGMYVSAPTTSGFTFTAAVMASTLWQYHCI